MSKLLKRVQLLAKSASSVKHEGRIAYVVPREYINELNKSINLKLNRTKKKEVCSLSNRKVNKSIKDI